MQKQFLTAKEAAELLNVKERTLHLWRKKKLLVPKTIGGKLLYPIETINQALRNSDEKGEK